VLLRNTHVSKGGIPFTPGETTPAQGEVDVYRVRGGDRAGLPIRRVTVDASGAFAIQLAPGRYSIVGDLSESHPPFLPGSAERLVTVRHNQVIEVTLEAVPYEP